LRHLHSVKGVPRFIDRKWDYEEGVQVLIMEYVEGKSLARMLRYMAGESLHVLKLFLNLVNVVQHIHEHGVVHRDITPENIMITTGGQVKLIDFDAAEFIGSTTGVRIYHGSYTAPEVKEGAVTYSSDVWSLGVILRELSRFHSLPIDTHYLDSSVIVENPYGRVSLEEFKNYVNKVYLSFYR
jgi:serine/threonine-protein kinase